MIVKVDIAELITSELTCSQFIFLKLLDSENELKQFTNGNMITNQEFEDLKTKKILTVESSLNGDIVTTKSKKRKTAADKFFDEFYETYPSTVVRVDNVKDFLRLNIQECRKAYNRFVGGSEENHRHIIDCLKYEIEYRRKTNKLGWMPRMQKWINTQQWQMAEEMMRDKRMIQLIEKTPGYGTDIV